MITQKIVNEIQNDKSTMKYTENVVAIDFETIAIINGEINWTIEDIIRNNKCHIYEDNQYTVIDDEVCDKEDIYKKQYEIRQRSDSHEKGYNEFREWYKPQKKIIEIKIESNEFYLRNMYQQWKKEEEKTESDKNNAHIKVKDVIEELKKFDPNLIIGFRDHEYGGFHTIRKYEWDDEDEDYNMLPKIRTIYDCPDCNRGCCSHCDGREIFKKKFLVL